MKTRIAAALATLSALSPAVASAHPGHGTTAPNSWTHYLTEPVHIAVLGVALAGLSLAHIAWSARRSARK